MAQHEDPDEEPLGLGRGRMDGISDGVFAVARTFLMLEVHLPREHEGEVFSSDWLFGLWPKLVSFAASFLIIAGNAMGGKVFYETGKVVTLER